MPLVIRARSLNEAETRYKNGSRAKAEPLEDHWLDHAHQVLDEMFPEADEEQKDIYACEEWQNALNDFENCNRFMEYTDKHS